MSEPEPSAARPAALGWRLLAIVYDAFPVLALWLATSAVAMLAHGNQPLAPLSPGQWLLFGSCWGVTGLYFVESWRRGGQTLGMRPWRLRVLTPGGVLASRRALWTRYALATLSWAILGLGFCWSLFERERRSWHDLGSRTVLLRQPK
jgi:uncharacterized RDD family membrane protein YckC